MAEYTIKQATGSDTDQIKQVLKSTNLPFIDIGTHLENFFVLKNHEEIIGTVGLEVYGEVALLRSLAVITEYQGKRLGQKLYQNIILKAQYLNIEKIYLLTETAENFFTRQGFQKIARYDVPASIQRTNEFRILCPNTAICMMLHLNRND